MSSSELISSATIAQRPIVSPHEFTPLDDSVVHMSRVTVRRGQNVLLDDVSWHVQEGERWIVMGPNGAGKSTLINIAAARAHPTSGNVRSEERRVGKERKRQGETQYSRKKIDRIVID